MCVICNCGDAGDEFLHLFNNAQDAMAKASQQMLLCASVAKVPQQRRNYDKAYKQMVKLRRDWNRIEQAREFHLPLQQVPHP